MHPDELIQLVKDSGLRGRGGAGFPTGMKWSFIPQNDGKPHYVVVNADEGEPGTCKDAPLMMADPHSLIEGIVIAAFAVRCNLAFIYLRGEVVHASAGCSTRSREAYAAGYLGTDILGSGFDLELVVHGGAGAYICGEETALLDSLEGYRGQPRLKPPFPATHGLYASPTVVNNVDTLASVPYIVLGGADWLKAMGPEKSPGPKIFSLSGRVVRPGQYEAPMGTTLRELLEMAGGIRPGHELKFWTPGGSSTPLFTAEHLDVPLDFDAVAKAGSMHGTTALLVFDETDSVVHAVYKWTTSTRTSPAASARRAARALLDGPGPGPDRGRPGHRRGPRHPARHLRQHPGRSFCALGDGATSPITSSLQYFRSEFEDYIAGRIPPRLRSGRARGSALT